MNVLQILYYTYAEFSLDGAICKLERDIAKLKPKVMSGDLKSIQTVWNKLYELDYMKVLRNRHVTLGDVIYHTVQYI